LQLHDGGVMRKTPFGWISQCSCVAKWCAGIEPSKVQFFGKSCRCESLRYRLPPTWRSGPCHRCSPGYRLPSLLAKFGSGH
jgi:hypothetical protein